MHSGLQREIRGGLTRVEAALDSLSEALDPGSAVPSPVVPKKRASTRLKNPSKKAKDTGGQSAPIRNPLLEGGAEDDDEPLEVESQHANDSDV